MNKDNIKEILTKIYDWAKGKGWNETIIKVVLGALFGIIATFCLSSCTLSYKTDDIDFAAGIITPIEYSK